MRFTDCCSRCRVAHMTKHIIYVLQREYIFYCIVIIEKGTNSPTHINLSVIPTGWVLVSYTHKAITEEFFKSANQSNSCIMQNLENSLTKQPIVSLLKQRFLKDSIP